MTHRDDRTSKTFSFGRPWAGCGGLLALSVLALLLFGVSAASAATWQTAKIFGPEVPTPNPPNWTQDVQLGGVGGMAVNRTGAGGVEPGTVYTVGASLGNASHVARFSPQGEFELAWPAPGICGPESPTSATCPTFATGNSGGVDVAVDQTTGYVYVFDITFTKVVQVYEADGSGPITSFGEKDPTGTAITSPGKIHGSFVNEGIAVDDSGAVYIFDGATLSNQFHRLMVFRPQTPGDYEHYVYAEGSDIGGGFSPHNAPTRPMVDDNGNVYISGETYIEMYNPAQPNTPICTFSASSGGITSAAVNPTTGAVFYYAYKPKPEIHQLAPCSGGKFVENVASGPTFAPVPRRGFIEAMAFSPGTQFANEEYSPGILYGGAPSECPLVGACPKDAEDQSAQGYMFATKEGGPPKIVEPTVLSESVTRVGMTTATLNAQVNPNGPQTNYFFQYISDAAYQANDPSSRFAGGSQAPLGNAVLGSGNGPLLAAATVGGLSPGTGYRYRVIAANGTGGSAVGADAHFQTFGAETEGLPDNRAYELASPSQKNGGEVLPAAPLTASCGTECKPGLAAHRFPAQVVPSGDSIAYQGQPFSLNQGSPEYDEYVSTRAASGWQTASMSPPLVGGVGGLAFEAYALDASLAHGLTYATNQALVPEAPANYQNIFSGPTANRFDLTPLLRVLPPNRSATGSEAFEMRYVGASSDLSRIFFEANDALTGLTLTAPTAVDGGSDKFNLYEWHAGQLNLVNVQPFNAATFPGASFGSGFQLATEAQKAADYSNAIAANGTLVFWSSESGQVYVRENGERTREVPDHAGKFLTASVDGGKVLLSDGVLYNLQTGGLTDLTSGAGGFEGLVGQSDDLSSIYFVASTVLTGSPNAQGATPQEGKDNLYSWRDGPVSFVGTLDPNDLGTFGTWTAPPVRRAAEASPDGRWLAFNSKANLTNANTVGACKLDPATQKYVGAIPCEEVYLFDSLSAALRCVSCSPTGAAPLGGSFLRLMGNAPGSLAQPRYLTNEGRFYFDSRDSLSGLDTNNGVEDVYQYEPAGIGSCATPGGCVSLISGGRGPADSNFLAADALGNNVFFTTRQRLVPRDQDELIDLYDARVGGGLAADYPSPPTACLGEGCQPPPAPAPGEPSPGSTSFQGPGNLKPQKAKKKHHKKKHKKHHKKKGKGKKHKKKRGGKKKKKGNSSQRSKGKHSQGGSK